MNQIVRSLFLLYIFFYKRVVFAVKDISQNDNELQIQPSINSLNNSMYFLLTKVRRHPSQRNFNDNRNILIHSELQINCPNTRDQCFNDLRNATVKFFTANLCLVAATQLENLNCRYLKLSRAADNTLSFDVVEEKLYDIIKSENTSLVTPETASLAVTTDSLNEENLEFYPFSKNGTVSYHATRFFISKPQSYVYFKINENEEFVLSYIYVDPVYEKFDDIRRTYLCHDPAEQRILRLFNPNFKLGHSVVNLFNPNPYVGIPFSLNETYPGIIPGDLPSTSRYRSTECFKEPLIPMLLNSTKTQFEAESLVHYYFHRISLDFCSLFLCSEDFCINVRDIFKYVRSVPSQAHRHLQEKNNFSDSILSKRLHISGDLLKKKFNNLKQWPSPTMGPLPSNISNTLQNFTETSHLKTGDWRSAQSIKISNENISKSPQDSKIITISQDTLPDVNFEKLSQVELLNHTNKERRFQHKKLHLNRSKHLQLNKRFTNKYSINDFRESFNQKLNKWKNNTLEIRNETLLPIMTLSDKLKKSLHQKKNAQDNTSKISLFNNHLNSNDINEGKENHQLERSSIKTSTGNAVEENRFTLFHRKKLNHFNRKINGIHVLNRTEHSHH